MMRPLKILLLIAVIFLSACAVSNEPTPNVEQSKTLTFQPSKDFAKNVDNIGPKEENVIGRAVAARIFATYGALNASTINQYVNKVGQAVAAASSRPETFSGYSFAVLDTKELNAMAAPGGYIFISLGFLKLLPDEDTLAAVLAHEVGHVIKKHGLHAIKPGHLADYVAIGGALASSIDCSGLSQQLLIGFGAAINDVIEALVEAGYSREQEYEADSEAVSILSKAGYNPNALNIALKILERNTSSGGWFKTHPKPEDRVLEISSIIPNTQVHNEGFSDRRKRFKSALKSTNP